jgi:hypothetical protein
MLRQAFNLMNQTFADIDEKRINRASLLMKTGDPFRLSTLFQLAALAARQWLKTLLTIP